MQQELEPIKTKNQFKIFMKKYYAIFPLFLLIAVAAYQPKPWPVPDKFQKMANPVKSDAESIASGKELWAKHC